MAQMTERGFAEGLLIHASVKSRKPHHSSFIQKDPWNSLFEFPSGDQEYLRSGVFFKTKT